MKQILTLYTNCGLGGMTTVYKNRSLQEKDKWHNFIFNYNHGGLHAFSALPHATCRIVQPARMSYYIKYATSNMRFEEVRVTSLYKYLPDISRKFSPKIVYEFHSPEPRVISAELKNHELGLADEIWTPSDTQTKIVRYIAPEELKGRIRTKSNPVNQLSIDPQKLPLLNMNIGDKIPLLWVGRFDTRKNYIDMLRILKRLPMTFFSLFVISFSLDSAPISQFVYDALSLELLDRIHILYNLEPENILSLLATVKKKKGIYCSTALDESFGYSILEAASLGVETISYKVGAPLEFENHKIHFIDICDINKYVETILHLYQTSA